MPGKPGSNRLRIEISTEIDIAIRAKQLALIQEGVFNTAATSINQVRVVPTGNQVIAEATDQRITTTVAFNRVIP